MRLKAYLKGLGLGIFVTALIMSLAVDQRKELSDDEIRERAAALGMVSENSMLLTQAQKLADDAADQAKASKAASEAASKAAESANRASKAAESENAITEEQAKMPFSKLTEEDRAAGDGEDRTTKDKASSEAASKASAEAASKASKASAEAASKEAASKAAEASRAAETSKASKEKASAEAASKEAASKASAEAASKEAASKAAASKEAAAKASSEAASKEAAAKKASLPDVVNITVNRGEGSGTVAEKMFRAGLVDDAKQFDAYLVLSGYDRHLVVGTHSIPKDATPAEMGAILTSGR